METLSSLEKGGCRKLVRRRGNYEIRIVGKQLSCPHCDGAIFSHREIYIDVVPFVDEEQKLQLTLQSLTCKDCGNIQQFQQLAKGMETNIVYKQVD